MAGSPLPDPNPLPQGPGPKPLPPDPNKPINTEFQQTDEGDTE